MRSFTVVRACVLAAVAAAALVASKQVGEAQPADLLAGVIDGTFEADGGGWATTAAGRIVLDGDGPVHSGSRAARVEATRAGQAGARTKYWLVPTVPGVAHTARLWLYDNDPGTSSIEVELAFLGTDGTTRNAFIEPVGSSTSGWRLVTISLTGVAGTAYVSVEVRATAAGAGADFYLDDVSLERDPLPPPTPTSTATPVATLPASPTATSTGTPASGPSPTPSATSTPSPTATAVAAPAVFDVLTNGDFSAGLYGWRDVGADVEAAGGAARITSGSTSTKYLYQAVRVSPGGWYEGGAYLAARAGVDAAWVRVAWYASGDGSGSQLATADSPVTSGTDAVRTGAVQAPLDAHSAQVRVMLRPLGGGFAELTIDDVWFEATSAPPPPAPTASASGTVAPGPSVGGGTTGAPAAGGSTEATADAAGPRAGGSSATEPAGPASAGSRGGSASGGGSSTGSSGAASRPAAGSATAGASGTAGTAPATPRLEGSAAEILLRITELMPDPMEPGNDADFEWVEVSNVGTTPVSLAGMMLRDNAGVVALPDLVLAAGASLVVAGPRAAVPQASAFWPAGGLSNGLGNSGDRLALLAADGRVIDALSYGSDAAYDRPPLPAPGAGRSLKRFFGDDGTFAGFEVSSEPSPGRFEPPPATLESDEEGSDGAAGNTGDGTESAWYVLGGLAVVGLAGAAGQRLWALRRGGGGPAAGEA